MELNAKKKTQRSMRSTLRSLTLSLGTVAAVGAMAQQPYTWMISGTVAPCYPGQVVNVHTMPGTLPAINIDLVVDSNTCSFSTELWLATTPSAIQLSTQCGGAFVSVYDSASFGFLMDTVFSTYTLLCNGGPIDCLGQLNGPNMPGTACSDNDPNTFNDTWDANCICVGNSGGPNMLTVTGLLSGCTGPSPVHIMDWWTVPILDTVIYTDANCGYSFTYSPTNNLQGWVMIDASCDGGLTWMWDSTGYSFTGLETVVLNFTCGGVANDCLGIPGGLNLPGTTCTDIIGGILLTGTWDINCNCVTNGTVDCLGFLNGPNMPGTMCTDTLNGAIFTGVWTANCVCLDTLNNTLDCLGIPFGPNMPGTACNDGDSLTYNDLWSANCVCMGVFLNPFDCNGVLNGPDMPGTACDDGDPNTSNDMWDANCVCAGSNNTPCVADFWVLQGFTVDSLNNPQPIPNELWIWNLSTGGSGTYSFLWSFGDGTSSTAAFPSHQYANGGPYALCLTIDDGAGCTSTHCDTVSVDANGMYTGFTGGNNQRTQGFTINVQNQIGQDVIDHTIADGITTWPNPALDELNIALSDATRGNVDLTVTDANGRVVMAERHTLLTGRNQMVIGTSGLASGLYMLRISNGEQMISQRFVKSN